MKACCVLESILRKKVDDHFSIISSYFSENRDSLVKCCELPQVSLREKANKVSKLFFSFSVNTFMSLPSAVQGIVSFLLLDIWSFLLFFLFLAILPIFKEICLYLRIFLASAFYCMLGFHVYENGNFSLILIFNYLKFN